MLTCRHPPGLLVWPSPYVLRGVGRTARFFRAISPGSPPTRPFPPDETGWACPSCETNPISPAVATKRTQFRPTKRTQSPAGGARPIPFCPLPFGFVHPGTARSRTRANERRLSGSVGARRQADPTAGVGWLVAATDGAQEATGPWPARARSQIADGHGPRVGMTEGAVAEVTGTAAAGREPGGGLGPPLGGLGGLGEGRSPGPAGLQSPGEGLGGRHEGVEHRPVADARAADLADPRAAGLEGLAPGGRIVRGAGGQPLGRRQDEHGVERARGASERGLEDRPQPSEGGGRVVEGEGRQGVEHRARATGEAEAEVAVADGLVEDSEAVGRGDQGLGHGAEAPSRTPCPRACPGAWALGIPRSSRSGRAGGRRRGPGVGRRRWARRVRRSGRRAGRGGRRRRGGRRG